VSRSFRAHGSAGSARTPKRRSLHDPVARRLRFEPLEERRLLSITVNTLVDENDGISVGGTSLRDAIAAASPGDTINFAPSLTSSGPATILLTHGELSIKKSLTISGPGADVLTINAKGSDSTPDQSHGDGARIFNINDATITRQAVAISGLALTGGDITGDGGAILDTESLTLSACRITGNSATNQGGGLFAGGDTGDVSVDNCEFTYNSATFGGAGISFNNLSGKLTITGSGFSKNSGANLDGGTVLCKGSLVVSTGYFFDNAAGTAAINAIGHNPAIVTLTVTDSFISDNAAGGILANQMDVQVTHCTIQRCTQGAGIDATSCNVTVTNCAILQNYAGGGIRDFVTNLTINGTVIDLNGSGNSGGGVYHYSGNLAITDSAITGNTSALKGGGVYAAWSNATITNTTISGNATHVNGGGIFTRQTDLKLVNSTISGNYAWNSGGGLYLFGSSSFPFNNFDIRHTTITANNAGQPTGIGGGIFLAGSKLSLDHVIAAQNSANIAPDISSISGSAVQSRYSLIGSNIGLPLAEAPISMPDANGNMIGGPLGGTIDAKLGPIADNFGPAFSDGHRLQTHALLPSSPALDRGDQAALAGFGQIPLSDERGDSFRRVVDGDGSGGARIDIGAVEQQIAAVTLGDYNHNGLVDAADYVLWRKGKGTSTDFRGDGDNSGYVDSADYTYWRARFGNVLATGSALSDAVTTGGSALNSEPSSVSTPRPTLLGIDLLLSDPASTSHPSTRVQLHSSTAAMVSSSWSQANETSEPTVAWFPSPTHDNLGIQDIAEGSRAAPADTPNADGSLFSLVDRAFELLSIERSLAGAVIK
jgi:hypothetical protein